MGRKKLPMIVISKKRSRLLCFEKRKRSLKKAAYELSTLCGVDIGMIIYDRDSNESEISGSSLARMVQLYGSSSAQDRRYRAYSVVDYVKEEIEKAKKKREKMESDECGRLSLTQLRELGELLDSKIGAVRGKISRIKAEADRRVFSNHQKSGMFLNQNQKKPMFWGNSSLNQDSGLFLNPSLQYQSGVCLNPFMNQESRVCLNQDQQQTMFWGNSSLMQENLSYLMADDVYGDVPETNSELDIMQDYEGSEATFWGNSRLMQEAFLLPADTEQQQQQIDLCNSMQYLVNPTMMNQSVEGTQNFMPGVIQQQWQAYYHPQQYQSSMGI